MSVPVELHSKLSSLLGAHPAFGREAERRALLLASGLDEGLVAQVDLGGAPFAYLARLIGELAEYGEVRDGRDALDAFLEQCRELFGVDGVRQLDEVIAIWRRVRAEQGARTTRTAAYLTTLVDRWSTLSSPLLPPGLRLADIAVGLRVKLIRDDMADVPKPRIAGSERTSEVGYEIPQLLRDTLDVERWLLFGDPGTGKTTLSIRVAAQLAREALEDGGRPVPIFARFSSIGRRAAGRPGYTLYEYLDEIGAEMQLPGLAGEIRRLARRGQVIFILDGADEVPEDARGPLLELIDNGRFSGSGNRVLITSRRVGASVFLGYDRLEIIPPGIDAQRGLLLTVCGTEKTQRLLAEISGRPAVREMARIPMMLTVLALVAREADVSSTDWVDYFRRQTDLFRLAVRLLLEGRHRDSDAVEDPYRAERVLARTSLRLHHLAAVREGEEVFRYDQVEEAVASVGLDLSGAWRGPRHFIDDIASKSSIIHPTDPLRSRYRYLHRSLREYLAALELSSAADEERQDFVRQVMDQQAWAEVLVLLGGLVSDGDSYIRTILQGPPDLALRALKEVDELDPELAARVLSLRPGRLRDRRQVFVELIRKLPVVEQAVDLFWAYLKSAGDAIPRVDIFFIQESLRALNTPLSLELAGDVFRYLQLPPEYLFESAGGDYWCEVPAGPCVVGGAQDDSSRPPWVPMETRIWLSDFDIGRMPVTNAIYEVFDPDHRAVRSFQDLVVARELDQHPVVGVSWYEAQIFCEWAAQRHQGVRMPTEFEWEKAASWNGARRLRFPWGDEWDPTRLNSWEAGPNRTTPVGSYPQGVSPVGALDMAGNVWEWCINWFVDDLSPEDFIRPASIGERRVDRGGGWYHDVGRPCAFLRAADDPADRFAHCGFRVARSSQAMGRGTDISLDL